MHNRVTFLKFQIYLFCLGNETRIGIYSRNCPEWFISALACVRLSMVTVSFVFTILISFLYRSLFMIHLEPTPPRSLSSKLTWSKLHNFQECLTHSSRIIIVDDPDKIEKLLVNIDNMPTLKHIVLINADRLSDDLGTKARKHGLKIHKFDKLQNDQNDVHPDVEPSPDDLYIIW